MLPITMQGQKKKAKKSGQIGSDKDVKIAKEKKTTLITKKDSDFSKYKTNLPIGSSIYILKCNCFSSIYSKNKGVAPAYGSTSLLECSKTTKQLCSTDK
jgi:hypothetical protein